MHPSSGPRFSAACLRFAGLLAVLSQGFELIAADPPPQPQKKPSGSMTGKFQGGGDKFNVGTNTNGDAIVGTSKLSGSVPATGTQEASLSVPLAGGKLGPVKAEVSLDVKAKTEPLGRQGQNAEGIYDERNFGSVTTETALSGSLMVEAGGAAAGIEGTTRAKTNKFTIDQRSSPIYRDRAEKLHQADKAIFKDQYAADEQGRKNQAAQAEAEAAARAAAATPRSKDANEAIANYNRTQAELEKARAGMMGEKPGKPKTMEPLPIPPAEQLTSGYAIYKRPAGLADDDWQMLARGFAGIGEIQVTGNQVRIRCENLNEAGWREMAGLLGEGWTIQRDAAPALTKP